MADRIEEVSRSTGWASPELKLWVYVLEPGGGGGGGEMAGSGRGMENGGRIRDGCRTNHI